MTNHRAHRWFQLSLKSLFLLTLLVATFFAGYSLAERHAKETMRAEQEARRLGETSRRESSKVQQEVVSFYIGTLR